MFHNENFLNGPHFSDRSTTLQYHQTGILNFYTLLCKSKFIEPLSYSGSVTRLVITIDIMDTYPYDDN
jgi:hypothetical protein